MKLAPFGLQNRHLTGTITLKPVMMFTPVRHKTNWICSAIVFPLRQGVSQDLEIGCPNLIEISKQGVQIVHLHYIYM